MSQIHTDLNKNREVSREKREKLRNSHLGVGLSESHRQSLVDSWKMRVMSEEHRKKLDESRRKICGKIHYKWKGDSVGYRGIHYWVEKHLGKPMKCSQCNLDGIPEGKKRYFQWANVSRGYKRDLSDWIRLCLICHKKYDSKFTNC